MSDETPLATVEDYSLRYGEPAEPRRVEALLSDATALLLSAYESHWGEPYALDVHPAFDRAAVPVCCKLAHGALEVPDGFAGASQYSQTAGSYNASVTYGAPLGDMWLAKSDLRALGLSGAAIRSIRPQIAGGRHGS